MILSSFYWHALLVLACLAGLLLISSAYLQSWQPSNASTSRQALHDNVRARIGTWWWILGAVAVCVPSGRWGVLLLFFLVSLLALKEFISVLPTAPEDHLALVLLFWLVLPIHYALIALQQVAFAFLLTPVLAALGLALLGRGEQSGWRFFGVVVCVVALSVLPALVASDNGRSQERNLMLAGFVLLIVQMSDVSQFLWGKALGRHALAPQWSPGKTWEGLGGGLLTAGLLGALAHSMTPFSMSQATLVAVVLSGLGVLGGLLMSAIKRKFGVKDWGAMLSGHGGVLDRVDSLILSAPALYAYMGSP
jgi:phosphatidate cytidylyltransferase